MAWDPLKIGKHVIPVPIVQGGMGLGVSWDRLAGAVSHEGGLGVISSVGTGYYQDLRFIDEQVAGRPLGARNLFCGSALKAIFDNARKICGDAPLACNILYAINGYDRVVKDACEAGADIIITGAGLPVNMPKFTREHPDVALVPIVSTARALTIICRRWSNRYKRLPDAVVVEGPKSGGHQGFTFEQCGLEENQLENLVGPVVEETARWGDIPVIAAGGVWDKDDIEHMLSLGARGVQMGTRFIGTHECDAHEGFKSLLLAANEDDIQLMGSPVGYPARGIRTNLTGLIEEKAGPEIRCVSNCVFPCNRGEKAKEAGYCIADRLNDARNGDPELGLFFSGSNGHRLDKIISVKELMTRLTLGEEVSA